MLSQIKNTIKDIENSKDYQDWHSKNKSSYLCSAFLISENINEINTGWQIDYYNPEDSKITSFIMIGNSLQIMPPEEVFQKEKTKIKELNLNDIKIDLNKAIETSKKLIKDKYKNENPDKIIVVLQVLEAILWNITYLTSTFNIINIKINAIDNEILADSLTSVMSFKQK